MSAFSGRDTRPRRASVGPRQSDDNESGRHMGPGTVDRECADARDSSSRERLRVVGGRFRRVRRGGAESDFEAARRSRDAAASGECGVDLVAVEFGLAVAVAIRSSLSVDLPGAARRRWGVAVAVRPLALSRTPIPSIYPPGNPRNPSEFKGRALHGALVGFSCRAGSAARPSPIYPDPQCTHTSWFGISSIRSSNSCRGKLGAPGMGPLSYSGTCRTSRTAISLRPCMFGSSAKSVVLPLSRRAAERSETWMTSAGTALDRRVPRLYTHLDLPRK